MNNFPQTLGQLEPSDRGKIICSTCQQAGHFNCLEFTNGEETAIMGDDGIYSHDPDVKRDLGCFYDKKHGFQGKGQGSSVH
jgi:hypothetical protein